MMINDSRKPDSMMYIPELCGFVFLLESCGAKATSQWDQGLTL